MVAGNGRSVGARFVFPDRAALLPHEKIVQKFSTIQTLFSPVNTFNAA